VLLVDNGSTHFSPPAVLPGNTPILYCATPGSCAARNQALPEGRGEWLVFTDRTVCPAPAGWKR